jgi:hypothetical protein
MTALAAARQTESKSLGNVRDYLMVASTTIYKGGMVMLDANGLAAPAADTASVKGVVGVATETITSDASTATYIAVQEGTYLMVASSIADSLHGSLVYVVDDQTVDETTTNSAIAGILIRRVSNTSGWVAMGPMYLT